MCYARASVGLLHHNEHAEQKDSLKVQIIHWRNQTKEYVFILIYAIKSASWLSDEPNPVAAAATAAACSCQGQQGRYTRLMDH